MNIQRNSPSRLWLLPAAVIGLVLAGGCGNKGAGTQTPQANAGPVAPPAAPGSSLSQNPPAGQPNHMTPEMQAQIERYRSMGGKK